MVLFSVFVVFLVGVVAALASGRLDSRISMAMPDPVHTTGHEVFGPEPITGAEVSMVRFDRALRGYRMDQVDAVLDQLSAEIADRDEHIAALRARMTPQPEWPVNRPVDARDTVVTGSAADGHPAADPVSTVDSVPATDAVSEPSAPEGSVTSREDIVDRDRGR